MKEISEINKKINLGQQGAAVAPAGAKVPQRPSVPAGWTSGGGGLGMVNEMAPHLRK